MLKSVQQIHQPDPLVVTTCGKDGCFPITIEEHHEWIAEIRLSSIVPEPVRRSFDRARNAFLYAWFSYDLGALAESQALFCVEMALRLRLGERAHSKDSMSNLIEKTIKDGILQENAPELPRLATMLTAMRNEWAHGSDHIHTPAMTLNVIQSCADLINESFSSP